MIVLFFIIDLQDNYFKSYFYSVKLIVVLCTFYLSTDLSFFQISNIDFLDLVDSSGVKDNYLSQVNNPDTSVHHLKSATPDSDGSPLWRFPESRTFPRKPSFESPSPPYKLYPRRLY